MDGTISLKAGLYCCTELQQVQVHRLGHGSAAVFTARSPGKEATNEDAAAVIPFDEDSGILVVADGLGGARGGEIASTTVVEALHESLQQKAALEHPRHDDTLLRSGILNGIDSGNRRIREAGLGAATTLAVVEIQDQTVRPFHVGDSMILVVGQRGKIKLQTVSHSPVGFAVEAGLLDESDALHHEERHVVSNVVGTAEMRIEIGSTVQLAPRDTLLVASDGLFDNLRVEEIIERIRVGPLERAVCRLADDARFRMTHPSDGQPSKPDDLTVIAYRRQ